MKIGIELIAEERLRQINVEGWTKEHDLNHNDEELSYAAAAYALPEKLRIFFVDNNIHRSDFFPFEKRWWKPSPDNRIKELAKAGALIAAQIDNILNKEYTQCPSCGDNWNTTKHNSCSCGATLKQS
jgi:hypothetical protein